MKVKLPVSKTQVLDEGANVYVKDGWYPEREGSVFSRPGSRTENSGDLPTPHLNGEGEILLWAPPLGDNGGRQFSSLLSKSEIKSKANKLRLTTLSNREFWIDTYPDVFVGNLIV